MSTAGRPKALAPPGGKAHSAKGEQHPTAAASPAPAIEPILVVDDLRVSFPNRDGGRTEAVRGVSFALGRERLGIVGESGSGKSQTGRAILGLTAPEGRVTAKRLEFPGVDLLRCTPRQRRELRGGRIAMVLQDPKFSLNPVMTIGEQLVETLRAHTQDFRPGGALAGTGRAGKPCRSTGPSASTGSIRTRFRAAWDSAR